jgi:hypothetical protein
MPKWKELKQQVLASTQQDSHGESSTKKFLQSLRDEFGSKERIPLNQQHDMSLEHVGYIDNFQVVQADKDGKEWNLVGDVHFHDVEIDEAMQGFSYSVTEDMRGDIKNRQIGVYVPFPYYKDQELLSDLTNVESGIVSGAWRKKAADPATVSLIISFALFAVAPAYTNYWNNKVSPLLNKLLSKLKMNHSVEYIQTSEGPLGETFGIYFIPVRGKENECLTLNLVLDGIRIANDHIAADDLAAKRGVHLVKLIYSDDKKTYELKTVEYQDGSVVKYNR